MCVCRTGASAGNAYEMTSNEFDTIVIGSGIAGLISAGILSAYGLKVLVVEKHTAPGGYLTSFKRNGFIFDSAVDCISGVADGGLICRVLRLLNVDKTLDFVKLDPVRVSIFPDAEVIVDADLNTYSSRLSSIFPAEVDGIKKFFETACRIYSIIQSTTDMLISGKTKINEMPYEILRLIGMTYNDLLDEYFKDSRLKAVLSDRCPFIGLPASQVSAVTMIVMIMSYFSLGAYRAIGGFQMLPDAMVEGIRKKGGNVLLGRKAEKIVLDSNGRCKGIVCDNDEEFTSKHVISNADFNHTFKDLIGGRHSDIADDMNNKTGVSTSFFIVYAGIRGEINTHSSIGYFPSYDMESFFRPDMLFKDGSSIGITISSLEDKSRAPAGCHTVVIHEMAEYPYNIIDKAKGVEAIIRKMQKIMPIEDRVIISDSATPHTLQRYTGNHKGSAFGWRQLPGIRNMERHGIENLYIAGHWDNMGGGVLASAYSGARAAGKILAKEGIRFEF